jgi:mediator of RNA polymerase II transcription subunit 14
VGEERGGVVSGSSGRPEGSERKSMPGVIMENGMGDGARTNHDREGMSNGANGASHAIPKGYDKAGVRADPNSMQVVNQMSQPNGINGSRQSKSMDSPIETMPKDLKQQISQLPPEITNITQGYLSLTTLLSRLAQSTHNRLSEKINDMASMATSASFENGNINGMDDNSVDNIRKKVQLLKFAEETHGNWVKALVITQWSRISNDITKLVDLNLHMKQRISKYEELLEDIGQVKRQLYDARSPNPDLKTAVEVLTTGRASWMPDVCCLYQIYSFHILTS